MRIKVLLNRLLLPFMTFTQRGQTARSKKEIIKAQIFTFTLSSHSKWSGTGYRTSSQGLLRFSHTYSGTGLFLNQILFILKVRTLLPCCERLFGSRPFWLILMLFFHTCDPASAAVGGPFRFGLPEKQSMHMLEWILSPRFVLRATGCCNYEEKSHPWSLIHCLLIANFQHTQ